MLVTLVWASSEGYAFDLGLAAELLYFDYEETDINGNLLNQETGLIPGLSLTAAKAFDSLNNTFKISAHDGQVDYDGQTQSGQPHETTTEETIYRMLYKLSWSPASSQSALYGEAGWHQWDRDIQPTNGVLGLFERYQWWSLEAGIQLPFIKNDSQDLSLQLGMLTTFNGTIMIDLTEAGYGNHTLDLGDDFGFSGELNYRYRQASNSSLQLGLQVKTWDFGRSNSKTITNGSQFISITEPDSTSVQTTLSASYIHHF
ncbi:MAG: hypothetical protein KJP10_02280 [Gammaproteobacteria bacterium]|nr:hypothetical protein [Gammaproteobacteria bacterium]